MRLPTVGALVDLARARSGLRDLGDEWLLQPLQLLLAALEAEARLSEAGVQMTAERIVGALVNRLRLTAALARNPEIAVEKLHVAAVIVGLPRTGSTLLHRLLASLAPLTGLLWWESQYPFPFPEEAHGESPLRRAAAATILADWLRSAPELASITPIAVDEPDEETILLDQFFLSAGWEAMYELPSYSRHVEAADKRQTYADLQLTLKYLQWQSPARRQRGWILKSPTHLSGLDEVLEAFPDSLIIMPHRDPLQILPSYCSMETTLYGLASERVDPIAIGTLWSAKLQRLLRKYLQVRAAAGAHRFLDVHYGELIADTEGEVRKVLARLGLDVTPPVAQQLRSLILANARDKRAAHAYRLERFGLTEENIVRDFAFYREALAGELAPQS